MSLEFATDPRRDDSASCGSASRAAQAESQAGLQAVEVSRHFWGVNMPQFSAGSEYHCHWRAHRGNDRHQSGRRALERLQYFLPVGGYPSLCSAASATAARRLVIGGNNHHWGTVIDISGGGCYVECPTTYPVGQLLYVKLGIEDFKFESDAVVRVSHPAWGWAWSSCVPLHAAPHSRRFCAELARDPNRLR